MRPNPLIATRTAIQLLPKGSKIPSLARISPFRLWFQAPDGSTLQCIIVPKAPVALLRHSGALQALCRSRNHRLGGDAEMRVEVLGRGAGAEAGHADEDAIRPDHSVPAEPDRGLDRDLDRSVADHGLALRYRLLQQQIE